MSAQQWLKHFNKNSQAITFIHESAWRLVETQEIIATRKLVDSLEEQDLLEEMIETNKPPLMSSYVTYHPLLITPFRYPPLKYGSRFGRRTEPSLWYGSLALTTALAEKAFYQFNFLRASTAKFEIVELPLTSFSVRIKTTKGLRLTESPFANYTNTISSPTSYSESQDLGTQMRENNVYAFIFKSARDPDQGNNIGLFTPKAFSSKNPDPKSFQSWTCLANNQMIEFVKSSTLFSDRKIFSINQFMVNGTLPFPAN